MSNNAIINFLFNSQGAMREIDNFKSRFTKTLDAISKSSVGKFAALGASLTSIFSVRSFVTNVKELSKAYDDMQKKIPIDKIGKFANTFGALGAEQSEALSTLKKLQDIILKPNFNNEFMSRWGELVSRSGKNIDFSDYQKGVKDAVDLYDDLRDMLAQLDDEVERNAFLQDMGLDEGVMGRYVDLWDGMDIDKFRSEIDKMPTVTTDSYSALMNLNMAMQRLKSTWIEFGETIVKAGIADLIQKVSDVLKKFNDLEPETREKIYKSIMAFLLLTPAIKLASNVLGLAFSATRLAGPLAGILMISGAVYALANNLGGCRDKADELFTSFDNWLSDKNIALQTFLGGFIELAEILLHPKHAIYTLGETGGKLPEGGFRAARLAREQQNKNADKDADLYTSHIFGGDLTKEQKEALKNNMAYRAIYNIVVANAEKKREKELDEKVKPENFFDENKWVSPRLDNSTLANIAAMHYQQKYGSNPLTVSINNNVNIKTKDNPKDVSNALQPIMNKWGQNIISQISENFSM